MKKENYLKGKRISMILWFLIGTLLRLIFLLAIDMDIELVNV